jgi:hypothetical protein
VSDDNRTHAPSLHKILPHVIFKLVRPRELLDEMLDRVLAQPEKVRPRDRVRVLPVPDVVRRADDDGPGAGGRTGDDRLVGHVRRLDLELGAVAAVEDDAVV